MKLLFLSIIYSLLLINIPTYSTNEKESKEPINNWFNKNYDQWNSHDATILISTKSLNKTPSELADFFERNDVPVKQIERDFPNDLYEQNYQTARYMFFNSHYTFKEFLEVLKMACST